MQKGLKLISLQGAIEKSPILMNNWIEWLDGNIIISYFGGSNNIFAECISGLDYKYYIKGLIWHLFTNTKLEFIHRSFNLIRTNLKRIIYTFIYK